MGFLNHWLLLLLLLLPIAGAVTLLFVRGPGPARWTSIGVSLGALLVSLALLIPLSRTPAGFGLGLDGLSFPFIVLATVLCAAACVASFAVDGHVGFHCALILLLESATIGFFLSFNQWMGWACFASMILPAFLMARNWGGERRRLAARQFAVLMLIGAGCLLLVLTRHNRSVGTVALLLIGFGIRLPLPPFHGWLRDVVAKCSPPASLLLTSLFSLTGGYGLVCAFPSLGQSGPVLSVIGAFALLYGAGLLLGQTDPAKAIVSLAVASAGFVMLGLANGTWAGANAAVFTILAQGLIVGLMSVLLSLLAARLKPLPLQDATGLGNAAPMFATFLGLAWFSQLTVPGLVGPVFTIIAVLAKDDPGHRAYAIALPAILGTVLIAAGSIRAVRSLLGGSSGPVSLQDLNGRELTYLVPLAVLTVLLGAFSKALCFAFTSPAIEAIFRSP